MTSQPNQPVPKKNKIVQSKNEANSDATLPTKVKATKAPRKRRATKAEKSHGTSGGKSAVAQTQGPVAGRQPGTATEPSDDAIRLRAYFISERRRRFALPGDADSDWLEAKRQLLAEIARG